MALPNELTFTLYGRVEFGADTQSLRGTVYGSDVDDAGRLVGEVSFDTTVDDMARPRNYDAQDVGFVFMVDGVRAVTMDQIGNWEVERSVASPLARWSVDFPVRTADGVWGNPINTMGNPLGLAAIDIYGIYRTSTGAHLIQLVKNGICDPGNYSRTTNANGTVDHFEGVCSGGRYDGATVTLMLGPGHGLRRDQIIRRLLELAGETNFSLDAENPCYKEFQCDDDDPLGRATELANTDYRRLCWRSDATFINPFIGPPPPIEQIGLSFNEHDILSVEGFNSQGPVDVVTQITINGTEQKVREECGLSTPPPTEQIQRAKFNPTLMRYEQNSDFSLTDFAPVYPTPEIRMLEKIVSKQTYRCGILLYELTQIYRNYDPLSARYQWNASGTAKTAVNGVWLNTGAAPGPLDNALAYVFSLESWRLVSETEVWHCYNQDGYQTGPGWGGVMGDDFFAAYTALITPNATYPRDGNRAGFYLGSLTERRGWYVPRAALKEVVPGTPIDETPYIFNRYTSGNGEGFAAIRETYGVIGRSAYQEFSEEVTGTKTNTINQTMSYTALPGDTFWWAEGVLRGEIAETLQVSQIDTVKYISAPESEAHKQIATSIDAVGNLVTPEVESPVDGAPPVVDKIPQDEIDDSIYDTDADRERKREASRSDSNPFTIVLNSPSLETRFRRKKIKMDLPYAENDGEAMFTARAMMADKAATRYKLTLAANFTIVNSRSCKVRVVNHWGPGYQPLTIETIRWYGDGQSIKTDVSGKRYLAMVA